MEIMCNKMDGSLINCLKGRISKILGGRVRLRLEEKASLESVYITIDKFFLSKKELADKEKFIKSLKTHLEVIKGTRKVYIKDHIIPVMEILSGERNSR